MADRLSWRAAYDLAGWRTPRRWLSWPLIGIGAAGATAALLVAVRVFAIDPDLEHYRIEVLWGRGTIIGAAIVMALMALPFLAVVAVGVGIARAERQGRAEVLGRIGARRADLRRVAMVEALVVAAVGAVLGTVATALVLRGIADSQWWRPRDCSGPQCPTYLEAVIPPDLPGWPWVVASVLATLAAGAVIPVVNDRAGPRSADPGPPRLSVLAVALGACLAAFFVLVSSPVGAGSMYWTVQVLIAGIVVLSLAVVREVAGLASSRIGRRLLATSSSPPALLAGGRLMAQPGRTAMMTGLLGLAVIVRLVNDPQYLIAEAANQMGSMEAQVTVVFRVLSLVLAAAVAVGLLGTQLESVLSARREWAALAASGVDEFTLLRALVIEAVLRVLPSVVVAAVLGLVGSWAFFRVLSPGYGLVLNVFPWQVAVESILVALIATLVPALITWAGSRHVLDPEHLRVPA